MSAEKVDEKRRGKKPYLPPQVVTRPADRPVLFLACTGRGEQCLSEPGECCVPDIALCDEENPPCS